MLSCGCCIALTSKDWAELFPAGDATLRGVLAKCHLQEEDWQTSTEQEDGVRDEKRTCGGEDEEEEEEDGVVGHGRERMA